jgi:hypothetical protein
MWDSRSLSLRESRVPDEMLTMLNHLEVIQIVPICDVYSIFQ